MFDAHIRHYVKHLIDVKDEMQWHLDNTSDHTNSEWLSLRITQLEERIEELTEASNYTGVNHMHTDNRFNCRALHIRGSRYATVARKELPQIKVNGKVVRKIENFDLVYPNGAFVNVDIKYDNDNESWNLAAKVYVIGAVYPVARYNHVCKSHTMAVNIAIVAILRYMRENDIEFDSSWRLKEIDRCYESGYMLDTGVNEIY